MTQKNKKQKGKRNNRIEHKAVKISKIIKLDYIVEMICWCNNSVTIDSSKPMTENVCSSCGSPIKLLDYEWDEKEVSKFLESSEVK